MYRNSKANETNLLNQNQSCNRTFKSHTVCQVSSVRNKYMQHESGTCMWWACGVPNHSMNANWSNSRLVTKANLSLVVLNVLNGQQSNERLFLVVGYNETLNSSLLHRGSWSTWIGIWSGWNSLSKVSAGGAFLLRFMPELTLISEFRWYQKPLCKNQEPLKRREGINLIATPLRVWLSPQETVSFVSLWPSDNVSYWGNNTNCFPWEQSLSAYMHNRTN